MHPRIFSRFKQFAIAIVIFLVLFYLSLNLIVELLKHRTQTLEFLVGIDHIKPWFFVMRLTIYLTSYVMCGWLFKKLQPNTSDDKIALTRSCLVKFFMIYELLFGINIMAFVMR